MDRFLLPLLFSALVSGIPSALQAQVPVSSRECVGTAVPCFTVHGRAIFESGATPLAEVVVRVHSHTGKFGTREVLDVRATAPEFRFEVRLPESGAADARLINLPSPWLNDGGARIPAPRGASPHIELRSRPGVPVTATFRYPQGTVAPPPFRASVRRSDGDDWFVPVEVTDGQFTFLARPDVGYTISAQPEGFGPVAADFPAQAGAHTVVVDVSRPARLLPQQMVLMEGRGRGDDARTGRSVWLPLVLEEPTPSGGGRLPYGWSVIGGPVAAGLSLQSPKTGRRQRVALAEAFVSNNALAEGPRSATIRFSRSMAGVDESSDVGITIVDDDAPTALPLLEVAGSQDRIPGSGFRSLSRPEGGPGEGWTITLSLDRPAPSGGAAVTVDTVSLPDLLPDVRVPGANSGEMVFDAGVARDPIDFRALVRHRVVFASGERQATVRIDGIGNSRVQSNRSFFIAFTEAEGLVPSEPSVEMMITDDDVDLSPVARNDLLTVPVIPQPSALDVLANDTIPAALYEGGRLIVVDTPRFGSIAVHTAGTPTPLDDRLVYTPSLGSAGSTERLRYRLCDALDERCLSAVADLRIGPVPTSDMVVVSQKDAGFVDVGVSGLPSLRDARFDLLLSRHYLAQTVSLRPDAPLAGLTWSTEAFALPALDAGQSVPRAFLFHLRGRPGSDVDLHVAYDANNDQRIDDGERLCSSAGTGTVETCLVRFTQTSASARGIRTALVNRGPTTASARFIYGSLDDAAPLAGTAATGPTRLAAGEGFNVRLSRRSDVTQEGDVWVGVLRIREGAGIDLGDVPVVIDRPGADASLADAVQFQPVALRAGVSQTLQIPLARSGLRDQVFVDVPPGIGMLEVALSPRSGARPSIGVSLRHVAFPPGSAGPSPPAAPPEDARSIRGTMGDAGIRLVAPFPAPGRWYVVLEDRDAVALDQKVVVATATLTSSTPAPVIRPGGYFNPARSGHGLFLYPAASDWAGLWYTYAQDSTPVWYYLQAPAPGANGIWTAPIFRSGWNGTRNHLTEVGRATITPTGADAFQFTYVLDGEIGSEPFVSFGRGCPSIGGRVVNASGHWFDPTRSGTGYSVQLLPNYEFHAVFAYAPNGTPRFLVAERSSVGAATDTLTLQQLRGFCPLCVRTGFPERADVGTLRREFTNGVLSRIVVDAAFTSGTLGTWTANDAVIPLGGLQGCPAN